MIIIGIIVALVLITVWLFAVDRYAYSLVTMAAIIAGSYYFVPEFAALVKEYGWKNLLVYGVPSYIGVGALVASLKWITFTRGIAERLTTFRTNFEESYGDPNNRRAKFDFEDDTVDPNLVPRKQQTTITDEQRKLQKREAFMNALSEPSASYRVFKRPTNTKMNKQDIANDQLMLDKLTPRTRNYLDRVTFWVVQWPIVLLDFVLSDLIIKLGENIAKLIDTVFSRLARMFVGNAVKGL